MAVTAKCETCGHAQLLAEEWAGSELACTACGARVHVLTWGQPPLALDAVFNRDRFLLKQSRLASHSKYDVCDDLGQTIAFVDAPEQSGRLRVLLAILLAVVVFFAGAVLWGFAQEYASEEVPLIISWVLSIIAFFAVAHGLAPKRNVTVYRDAEWSEVLLRIVQDKRWHLLTTAFTALAPDGGMIARLSTHSLQNLLQKRWTCKAPDGTTLCTAEAEKPKPDFLSTPVDGLVCAPLKNFAIRDPVSCKRIGEFSSKFTLLGRHVLDLAADPERKLGRRVALALGVMLDAAERR